MCLAGQVRHEQVERGRAARNNFKIWPQMLNESIIIVGIYVEKEESGVVGSDTDTSCSIEVSHLPLKRTRCLAGICV